MKIFTGRVISKNTLKTATVLVERVVVHPMYEKRFRRTKKFHVHDELDTKLGQVVRFVASRPYSKTKRWKIVEVVDRENNKAKTKKKSKGKEK